MLQSSHDSGDVTLGEEHQEELRDTLSGLAPRAQDPDEDEAYTPIQYEERLGSWDTFERLGNPLRSMCGLADDNTNSSSNNNSTKSVLGMHSNSEKEHRLSKSLRTDCYESTREV